MARLGRGRPHAPIILRNALVAVVASATVSPLHITLAERPAAFTRHTVVRYVRPSRSSLVPDRLAPQFTLVLAPRERSYNPKGDVLYIRPSRTSLVPDRLAPQVHVIQASQVPRHPGRDADVVLLRTAAAQVAAPTTPAPQPKVIAGGRDKRPLGGTAILFLRQLSVPDVDAGKATPQIHVVTLEPQRQARRPRGDALYVRPSRTSLVPDRIPPQLHAVLQLRDRALPVTHVAFLRNALVPPVVVPEPGPQIHMVSPVVLRQAIRPKGAVLYVRPSRTSLVPPRLAPQIHVISQVGSRTRVARGPHIALLHGYKPPPPRFDTVLRVFDMGHEGFLVYDEGGNYYLVYDAGTVRYRVEDV